jgi:catechol 2,3-dioxygenase-like lactoylglutathione lyase family enzyme
MAVSLVNHIGVTVPDIEAAFVWYRDSLGLFPLIAPGDAANDGTHFGHLVKDIFADRFEHVRMAQLATADGIGIELFQFVTPETEIPTNTFEYWRTGIFHFCLTVDDVQATATRISDSGGKQLSKVWRLFENKDYEVAYCQDPWGTVIELCNRSFTTVWANHETPVMPEG